MNILTNIVEGQIPIEAYLAISLVMFFAGIYGFLVRRSLLLVLISIELMLNAAEMNFAIFNRYLYPEHFEGFFFTLFAIAISACETAVAIAIIINIYRNMSSVDISNINEMKE